MLGSLKRSRAGLRVENHDPVPTVSGEGTCLFEFVRGRRGSVGTLAGGGQFVVLAGGRGGHWNHRVVAGHVGHGVLVVRLADVVVPQLRHQLRHDDAVRVLRQQPDKHEKPV